MSRIVDFHRGDTLHPNGASIDTIWGWNDRQLEVSHTYIQWLFNPCANRHGRFRAARRSPRGDFEAKSRGWLTSGNHNPLSITRILRSMVLLGLKREAVEGRYRP